MSKGFHISPKTGRSGVCDPKVTGICQFAEDGVEPPHYSTKDEAESAIQLQLKEEFGDINPITKKPFSKSYLAKRERDRRDKAAVTELHKFVEKDRKKKEAEALLRKNGNPPTSEWSAQREVLRENGIIHFKNGTVAKYNNYNQEVVNRHQKAVFALAEYAAGRATLSDSEEIKRRQKAFYEAAANSPKGDNMIRTVNILDNDFLLSNYANMSLEFSNDYKHGYPVGTTRMISKMEEENIHYDETNDVKEIKELYDHDNLVEPLIENIKHSRSISEIHENDAEYESFINGSYSRRLEAEVSPKVLSDYRDRQENEIREMKLNKLTKMKSQIKKPNLFTSRKEKEANARKIVEIDAMIQDL